MALPNPLNREEYANRFRSSLRLVMEATENRLRCLKQLMRCIEDCQQAVEHARQQHPAVRIDDTKELEQARKLLIEQQSLSVIVFGRSNTGKSTLLNQILRQWPDCQAVGTTNAAAAPTEALFPAAGHNCSARIAVVCYGPSREARVIDPRVENSKSAVLEQKPFRATSEIRDLMELTGPMRDSESELRKLVEIQLPHPLLQGRLRLVDSPGMGENVIMNSVVREFLSTLKSGIIIYVIDGKEGYKPNPDSENIKFLMEQEPLQKLIVANRIDFDFNTWFMDQPDLDWDLRDDPLEDILEGLREDIGFDFTESCVKHTTSRLTAVRQQVELRHPECLVDGKAAALIGVSAKSVKDFIAGELKLAYPPYVDSLLQLESRITALVYQNGRRHVLAAAQTARKQLVQAKTMSIDFYCNLSEKSDQMTQLLEKSIATIREIFRHICQSLNNVLQCDSLDLSSPGSELNRLKTCYVREDASPEQQSTDEPLIMRVEEAKLIQSMIKATGGSREAKAAVRLLCDFKDAVVSRLRTILMWNYKMTFMIEANRPLSKLDAQCKSLLDSLKHQSAQATEDKACDDVIDLVRSHMFMPDPAEFSRVCSSKLAESMRRALTAMTQRDEFRRVTDTLTQQFSRTEEERDRVLTYFMNTVDLTQQMTDVILAYRDQLNEQKMLVDNLLGALLENLRDKKMQTHEQMESARAHNEKMAAIAFYVDALVTEANWTADYDISLRLFQDECNAMSVDQSPKRSQRRLTPRLDHDGSQKALDLMLHYRLIRMQQDDARRLTSDVAQVSSRLAGPVRISWLCLEDTYRKFMEEATVQLMIGFDGAYTSLAELPPAQVSDTDRVAWLCSLLDCCARLSPSVGGTAGSSVTRGANRPTDYRPSCVLLRRLRADEISGGCGGLSSNAFPDPTRLLTDAESGLPEAASLAACAVVLFTDAGDNNNDNIGGENHNDLEDPHGWDARHTSELRLAMSGDRALYLSRLNRRLAVGIERPSAVVAALARCVRVCLALSDGAGAVEEAPPTSAPEQLQDARRALLKASGSTAGLTIDFSQTLR